MESCSVQPDQLVRKPAQLNPVCLTDCNIVLSNNDVDMDVLLSPSQIALT